MPQVDVAIIVEAEESRILNFATVPRSLSSSRHRTDEYERLIRFYLAAEESDD